MNLQRNNLSKTVSISNLRQQIKRKTSFNDENNELELETLFVACLRNATERAPRAIPTRSSSTGSFQVRKTFFRIKTTDFMRLIEQYGKPVIVFHIFMQITLFSCTQYALIFDTFFFIIYFQNTN